MPHKAGFVNIIGKPNAGKSTLMNALVGEKLSIITSKVQTTRHRILGILNGHNYQIVFSDTPGIIQPHYMLQQAMMKTIDTALEDADIFLLMTEINDDFDNIAITGKISAAAVPVLLLLNKIDLSNQTEVNEKIAYWKEKHPAFEIIPVSALNNFNIDFVLSRIVELLPVAEPYYPKEELTDKSERFFAAEIIREKILQNYQKEIPYSVEVVVENFREEKSIIRMSAVIYVNRDSQKAIIIGSKGTALKKTGTQARKELEKFFGNKVFIELYVKVSKNWRDNDKQLKRFGYL